MVQHLTVERRVLDGFEGLQEAVKGTHFDIVQLGRGRLRGSIDYLGIDDFALSLCAFSRGIRAQRTSADNKILIGMLLGAADRVTQWSFDMRPSDIVVIPPQIEHHAVHGGASSYAVIRLDPSELPSAFGGVFFLPWRAIRWSRCNVKPSTPSRTHRKRGLVSWVTSCARNLVWYGRCAG